MIEIKLKKCKCLFRLSKYLKGIYANFQSYTHIPCCSATFIFAPCTSIALDMSDSSNTLLSLSLSSSHILLSYSCLHILSSITLSSSHILPSFTASLHTPLFLCLLAYSPLLLLPCLLPTFSDSSCTPFFLCHMFYPFV